MINFELVWECNVKTISVKLRKGYRQFLKSYHVHKVLSPLIWHWDSQKSSILNSVQDFDLCGVNSMMQIISKELLCSQASLTWRASLKL